MRCSFEIFLRKGGCNRRLLLASRNGCFLCRRDNFRDRNNAVRINTSFLHVVKVLDFERKLLFSALLTSDFFSRYIDVCMKDTDLLIENKYCNFTG